MENNADLLQTPVRRMSLRRKRPVNAEHISGGSPAHKRISPKSTSQTGASTSNVVKENTSGPSFNNGLSQVFPSRRAASLRSKTPSREMATPKAHKSLNNNNNGSVKTSKTKKDIMKNPLSEESQHVHLHSPDGPFMSSQISGTQECEVVWRGTQDMEVVWDCKTPDALKDNLKTLPPDPKSCERFSPAAIMYTMPHRSLFNRAKSLQSTSVSLSCTTDQLDEFLNQINARDTQSTEKPSSPPMSSTSDIADLDEAILGDESVFSLSPDTRSTPPIPSDLLVKPLSQSFKPETESLSRENSGSSIVFPSKWGQTGKSKETSTFEIENKSKASSSKCLNDNSTAGDTMKVPSPDIFDDDLFDDFDLDPSEIATQPFVRPSKAESHGSSDSLPNTKGTKSSDMNNLNELDVSAVKDRGKVKDKEIKECEIDDVSGDPDFPDDFLDDFLIEQSQNIERELKEKGFEEVLATVNSKEPEGHVSLSQDRKENSDSGFSVPSDFTAEMTVHGVRGTVTSNAKHSKEFLKPSSLKVNCDNFKVKNSLGLNDSVYKSQSNIGTDGLKRNSSCFQNMDRESLKSGNVKPVINQPPCLILDRRKDLDSGASGNNPVLSKPCESQSTKDLASKKKSRSTFSLTADPQTNLQRNATSAISSCQSNVMPKADNGQLIKMPIPKVQNVNAPSSIAFGKQSNTPQVPIHTNNDGKAASEFDLLEDELFKEDFDVLADDIDMFGSPSDAIPPVSSNSTLSSCTKAGNSTALGFDKDVKPQQPEAQYPHKNYMSTCNIKEVGESSGNMSSLKSTNLTELRKGSLAQQKPTLDITDDDLFGDGVLALIDDIEFQANSQSSQSSTSSEKRCSSQEIERKKSEAKRRKEAKVNVEDINKKKEEALRRREEKLRNRQPQFTNHQSSFKR